MNKRPLVFVILGIFLVLEPLLKILAFKFSLDLRLSDILNKALTLHELREIFDFWFLFPLSGIALLSIQRFSYISFIVLQVYSVFTHLTHVNYTYPYSQEFSHFLSIIFLTINCLIIFYFLFPDVKKPFFDESIQWWKRKPRFKYKLPCSLVFGNPDQIIDTEILSISHSGCFVKLKDSETFKEIKTGPDEIVKVHISYQKFNTTLFGNIVSISVFEDYRGIGIKFLYKNIWENLNVRKLISTVAKHSAHLNDNKDRNESNSP